MDRTLLYGFENKDLSRSSLTYHYIWLHGSLSHRILYFAAVEHLISNQFVSQYICPAWNTGNTTLLECLLDAFFRSRWGCKVSQTLLSA